MHKLPAEQGVIIMTLNKPLVTSLIVWLVDKILTTKKITILPVNTIFC